MANSALNPNIVKTALDKEFFQEFNFMQHPGYADVTTPAVFNQMNSDRGSETHEVFRGSGAFEEKGESQNAPAGQSRSVNQVTYTHTTFAKSEEIPKEFFDDDQHSFIQKIIKAMGRNARQSRNQRGFSVYRNAFNSAYPGGDGVELISTAHPIATGTQSNEVASNPVLSETSLNTAIVQLLEMKSQDGVIMGHTPSCLLVPPALFKTACEIVDSELKADTANNNVNVYSSKYGIMVYTNQFLGAAAGGSDTAWFLHSDFHSVNFFDREPVNTTIKDWRETRNHNYIYSGRFRQSVGFDNYAGIVGSDGTAS